MFRGSGVLVALALAATASAPSAQCFSGPDGLSGPCCTFVPINLPSFPPVTLPSTAICWDGCAPTQQCTEIFLGGPFQTDCDTFQVQLSVADCAGTPLFDGLLQMDYTRTWDENDSGALRRLQVYRFAVKVDLNALAPVTPCLVPPCYSTFGTAFYYGYLDYAFDCDTGGVESSLVLFHNCDDFVHHPLSTHAGSFHPDQSYALVGPSTGTNPFVASYAPPPLGSMTGEGLRLASTGVSCVTEDRIDAGSAFFLGAGCGCELMPGPLQLAARRLRANGACPGPPAVPTTTFQSANSTPSFPWFHDMVTAIGAWTTPTGYPGEERAWVNEVPIFYRDACSATLGLSGAFGEVYYGATTEGGYTPTLSGGTVLLDDGFTDLASNTSWPVPGPPPSTFMGSVLPTRNLIYFNL